MKQLVICMDVNGYTERLRALRDAHTHVVGVTPHDRPCKDFTPIQVPDEWLPSDLETPYSRKCWHATGTLGLEAILQLGLVADHYWFVESDCVASQKRWKEMFADNANNPADGLFVCTRTKQETAWNPWWSEAGVPEWASLTHINAIYRISAKAVEAWLSLAEDARECFGEMVVGSVVAKIGGSIGRINHTTTHLNSQTIKADPNRVIFNRNLVNHPVKSNTYST